MTQIVTVKWGAAVNGDYTDGADWTPSGVPNNTAAFDYYVYIGGSYSTGTAAFTVTSSASETIGFLELGANATFAINGGHFAVNSFLRPESDIFNLGKLNVAAAATLSVGDTKGTELQLGDIDNTGTVTVAGTLQIEAPRVGLLGTGLLALSGKIIGTTPGGQRLDNQSTIIGAGAIGSGTFLQLVNAQTGRIIANAAAALTLNTSTTLIENAGEIETTGAGGLSILSTMQNNGLLLDAGKGALRITSALVEGGGDLTIDASAATILKSGELMLGGVVDIASGGALYTSTGDVTGIGIANTLAGDVLSAGDVEDDGKIIVNDHSILNLNSSLYGAGVLDMDAATAATEVEIYGNGASLYQTGGVVMSNDVSNKFVSNGAGVGFSNYVKISGAGFIGDGFLRLYNAPTGVIQANDSNYMAIVADTKAVNAGSESEDFNAGTITNTGSGGLIIENGDLDNAGYVIENGTGALTLSKLAINSGGGFVEVNAGRLVLAGNSLIEYAAGVDIDGGVLTTTAGDTADAIYSPLTNMSSLDIAGQSTLIGEGHWINDGTILVGTSSAAGTLEIEATATLELLGANGLLQLSNASDKITSAGGDTTLENKTDTISGAGTIGDASMDVNNEYGGVIDATLAGGLKLDAVEEAGGEEFLYNAGTIKADTALGVTIEAGMYSPGKLIADAGSKIVAQSDVFGAGTATINGAASIEFGGNAENDVYFGATAGGDLILDHSTEFVGDIYGMKAGDEFDLRDFHFVAAETGISATDSGFGDLAASLVLVNGTSTSTTIHLEGHYTLSDFQVVSDGAPSGGTLVKFVS